MMFLPAIEAKNIDSGMAMKNQSAFKNDYNQYYQLYYEKSRPNNVVTINTDADFKSNDADIIKGSVAGKPDALIWNNNEGEVTWGFNVDESGNYFLRVEYFSLKETAFDIQFGVKIDGQYPFFEAENIKLSKPFCFTEKNKTDKRGNDIRPQLSSYDKWITSELKDNTGAWSEPYVFYLQQGYHTLTFLGTRVATAFGKIEFFNKEKLQSYIDYSKAAEPPPNNYTYRVQAENALYVSSKSIYPTYDRTSSDTTPSDPVKLKYNTIGQSNYSSMGDYIVWNINVPAEGYYYLGARLRQNTSVGMVSYRKLYVNDRVPFEEANNIKIKFSYRWQDFAFGDEEPWLIYLNKGDNEIKLEVTAGDMADVIGRLKNLTDNINSLYRKIIMITGTSPDAYRDYKLGSTISGFKNYLQDILNDAESIMASVSKLGVDYSSGFSVIDKLKILIKSFIDDESLVANQVSSLNTYASSVSSLASSLSDNPLELDTITVSSNQNNLKTESKNIIEKFSFGLRSFIGTFIGDYNTGNSGNGKTLNVWINSGREQANIIQRLSDSSFTPDNDIDVKVNLVQQSLVQASLSGAGPDIALFIAATDTVNLAMRNGLAKFNDYKDFDTVMSRFEKCTQDPYYYDGNCYAVPLTQTFPMMFCRIDILEELGISVPCTWDDFYRTIRALQRNNLTVGIPNADAANVMTVNTNIFQTLLYQSGERMYSNDLKKTNLETEKGVTAFTKWTDFYKTYGLPYQFDFFNRFRSGDMPIGIYNYSLYGKLSDMAPEITGLWGIYKIPGTVSKNGETDCSVYSSGTGAVILNGTKLVNEAYAFLDWFTDRETQAAYGQELEVLLGPSGRYETANKDAFSDLPWGESELKIITEQRALTFTVPEVPGGYLVERNLINAFRKVVFHSYEPRETIMSYNKNIEFEIQRKREEFNLD